MEHGISNSPAKPSERRLSLPARVNVLVVDGQNYAQVSNLLRKNFKQSKSLTSSANFYSLLPLHPFLLSTKFFATFLQNSLEALRSLKFEPLTLGHMSQKIS